MTWGLGYLVKSMLNSVLVNKDFLTWPLIGWWLCCGVENQLNNMDFNMESS